MPTLFSEFYFIIYFFHCTASIQLTPPHVFHFPIELWIILRLLDCLESHCKLLTVKVLCSTPPCAVAAVHVWDAVLLWRHGISDQKVTLANGDVFLKLAEVLRGEHVASLTPQKMTQRCSGEFTNCSALIVDQKNTCFSLHAVSNYSSLFPSWNGFRHYVAELGSQKIEQCLLLFISVILVNCVK